MIIICGNLISAISPSLNLNKFSVRFYTLQKISPKAVLQDLKIIGCQSTRLWIPLQAHQIHHTSKYH